MPVLGLAVVGVLVLVPGDVPVALAVHPALLAAALPAVVEPLLVRPAVLGRVRQPVGDGALLDRLQKRGWVTVFPVCRN